MLEELEKCTICPHKCNIDRLSGKIGRCKATDKEKYNEKGQYKV